MEKGANTTKFLNSITKGGLSNNSNLYRKINGLEAKKKTLKLPTKKQIEQREKFRCVNLFVSQVNEAAKVGFYKQRKTKIAGNILVKQILKNKIIGGAPEYQIDYAKVVVSVGALSGANLMEQKISEGGTLYLTWELNQFLYKTDSVFDTNFVCIYNETTKLGYNFSGVGLRDDLGLNFKIPNFKKSDQLHVWLFFVGERNRNVSNSIYIKFS